MVKKRKNKLKVVKKNKVNKQIKAVNNVKSVAWIGKMSVEESVIDSQHKKLLDILNKIVTEVDPGEKIKILRETMHSLDEYVKQHFSYEEDYMLAINFPGYSQHKKIHENLGAYFANFKSRFNKELYENKDQVVVSENLSRLIVECRNYLASWLRKHILGEDQKYHKYAKKKKFIGKKLADIKNKVEKESSKKESIGQITQEVRNELIKGQRQHVEGILGLKDAKTKTINKYIMTGVPGFDDLLEQGIPRGSSIIVAGGTGSGKTILCLQTLNYHAQQGKKCMYITFEENEDRLINHMIDFGWDARKLIKQGNLKIVRMNPFDITRNVDAMLAKQKGELLIDIDPMLIPEDFQPDIIAIDSLTAIASAFSGKDDSYRIYIEQLFRFLEQIGSTNFLITETEQVPKIFSPTGVEEFLADGVFVLYSIKHGNVRENAIEILKLRGASHQKKIVAMQITEKGIVIYPEQEVFSEI